MNLAGLGYYFILDILGVPKSTVAHTMTKHRFRVDRASLPRSGAPSKLTEREKRYVLRIVRLNPKISYKNLLYNTGIIACTKTIQRYLKEQGITN
jgi:transposase